MKNLHLFVTNDGDELASPDEPLVYTFKTPAIAFIHDFKNIKPLAVDSRAKADEMKSLMLNLHVSFISVMDSTDHFVGIVSLDDLSDQNLIRKQAEGYPRNEIQVADFMTLRKDLLAFDSREIETASIGDVIESLKTNGRKECLVLDRDSHKIRGVFTISEISKKLQQPIEILDQTNLYRVFSPASYNSRSSIR
jgi:CBS domain containing-hemolysin-like protein